MVRDIKTQPTEETFVETDTRITIPITVILDRKIDTSKKWTFPAWHVFSIVTGEDSNAHEQHITEHDDGMVKRFYWGGLKLNLYKDGTEGYWYNLLSQTPYLFVICEGEIGDMDVKPRYVTANQDEANGHLESDDLVLSIAMPASIRQLLEQYVIAYYKPVKKKKRKRKDWLEDSLYAKKDGH